MSEEEIKQIEREGREAFKRGDNRNPYIIAPTELMTNIELDEWADKFGAWGNGWIDESGK